MKTVFVGTAIGLCLTTMVALDATAQSPTGTAGTVAATRQVKTFDSPKQAGDALVAAAAKFDVNALEQMFGPQFRTVVLSGESAQDRERVAEFATKAEQKTQVSIDPKTRTRAFLLIGNDDWPFPIPLVQRDGQWNFDTAAGREEILARRIGRNELGAIKAALAFYDAQNEYADMFKDKTGQAMYAQKIVSSPGKKDGLYWPTTGSEPDSPLGEAVASATRQGYRVGSGEPYHGYYFKILTEQGSSAPGGAVDYVVRGNMIGGFGLVAYPAEYGNSGIMTFIINNDGDVFEKDLGENTGRIASRTTAFNPDDTWKRVTVDMADKR